ncbi:putative protein kinase RLK-Pelle-DLSV family [Rosa chinensis]|uniref:Protein kinase domain-containing protein n=1 Tax=Rosa chinensis TaxID=74649 RepID=A0A2P6RS89_ROSCH|nr:putative protein kinase RLK-Pelle-DLSV family [Rosa chinensis]
MGFRSCFCTKVKLRWRAGSWIEHRWSALPVMTPNFIFNYSFGNNQDEPSVMYGVKDDSIFSRLVLDESGIIGLPMWQDQEHQWIKDWSTPVELCDNCGKCGPNSNCDPYHADGSSGCVRKKVVSMCKNGEGFVKVSPVKAPDSSTAHVDLTLGQKKCEEECLRNCSCMTYSSAGDMQERNGCVTLYGDFMDTRSYTNLNQDLYVRVDSIELGKERQNIFSFGVTTPSVYLEDSPSRTDPDDSRLKTDLPFFDLSTISAATKNFSDLNRLGEGRFGPFYKATGCMSQLCPTMACGPPKRVLLMLGDIENSLASRGIYTVKRLGKNSSQGNEEFKNEVVLIALLQHRNLVRLLGYCVQNEENMLIYQYLPNKSLDSFIFNEVKRTSLDWTRCLEIILGIARGILYLHQDSRLRIIHRDLKASNVLLDYDMNPKIADFGMARIFGANQIEGNTNHVVGTYGYMSAEYAMRGLFSVKKNTGYYSDNPDSNLVGHV